MKNPNEYVVAILLRAICKKIKNLFRRYVIRETNEEMAKRLGVRFGQNCKFININEWSFSSEPYLVTLGDHVELSAEVQFLPHDGSVWVYRKNHPDIDFIQPITVGNNVFIGQRAVIMKGANIGDNCIIGAYSVVSGVIPNNSVAAGIPARVIRNVDEHWSRIEAKCLKTKQLSREEKRKFLINHFNKNYN